MFGLITFIVCGIFGFIGGVLYFPIWSIAIFSGLFALTMSVIQWKTK